MKKAVVFASLFVFAQCLFAADPKPIKVAVGAEFKIALESNPSTGNQWLISRPLDERFVKFLGSEYKRGRTDRLGAPGRELLSFKALGEGNTRIYLKYGRLWEHDVEPSRTTNFVIVISKEDPSAK
ncbi:MAG TPA: protease inhibitor I42 family protein [Verrucomicrobiae bacterium]|jgi:inhibitor of cysteine peptidase|nr:protease inhibitor I42 family protein [Verrucomicrobiae bacterium]